MMRMDDNKTNRIIAGVLAVLLILAMVIPMAMMYL